MGRVKWGRGGGLGVRYGGIVCWCNLRGILLGGGVGEVGRGGWRGRGGRGGGIKLATPLVLNGPPD